MQNTSCSMDMYPSTHTGKETNVINKQATVPAVWTAEDASCNTHTHTHNGDGDLAFNVGSFLIVLKIQQLKK